MRGFALALATLIVSVPFPAHTGLLAAAADDRVPVKVSPEDAERQKAEMRDNLVALRDTLSNLAVSNYEGVESGIRRLGHSAPLSQRPGVSTAVFADFERQFERSVDQAVAAARSGNSARVLTALSETMGFCQSCHAAFRQSVEAAPAPAP